MTQKENPWMGISYQGDTIWAYLSTLREISRRERLARANAEEQFVDAYYRVMIDGYAFGNPDYAEWRDRFMHNEQGEKLSVTDVLELFRSDGYDLTTASTHITRSFLDEYFDTVGCREHIGGMTYIEKADAHFDYFSFADCIRFREPLPPINK